MASGSTLLVGIDAQSVIPPATTYAEQTEIAGTSTPAERLPVLAFDDSTVEYADWRLTLPRSYAGGGITLRICWSGAATTNNVAWGAAIRRIQDDAEDLDTTAHTYDFNTTADLSPPSAIGEVSYDDLAFTDGADMDSLAAGESFVLRVRRPASAGTKMTGDAYLHSIEIRET